ncbi:zinc finger protein ZAT5-like [Cynara cardunculus var. scolymus]|uniref:zinc finger protein ZAT5-like n=1 Tax=Cynara cardunculus var. scolymus TaxID=59895 RepID=UPI000D62FB80|nr:zinc finger protein ZAT5-like [Cynara cardunculus var. scolymus]
MEAHHQDDYNSIMEDSRNMVIKGKRTKRPRPSSPLALTMASTSSTTTTATTGATSDDHQDGDHTDINNPNDHFFHIPTNNSIEFTRILQEHDDEDMANCLILLAQGQANNSPSSPPPNKATEVAGAWAEVQVARTSGFYVYECKTCNRGFSSFQALGGHRASHKKPPKPTVEDKIRPNIVKQDVGVHHTTLSLQIGSDHQTYCQALGGHMRRHRSMPMATTTCSNSSSGSHQESKKPKTLLSLDLNLPAPVEDDHRETKFPFRPKDQMIVFSNSSLVHCHF